MLSNEFNPADPIPSWMKALARAYARRHSMNPDMGLTLSARIEEAFLSGSMLMFDEQGAIHEIRRSCEVELRKHQPQGYYMGGRTVCSCGHGGDDFTRHLEDVMTVFFTRELFPEPKPKALEP